MTFDPSPVTNPDVQEFESKKFGHTGLWIMLLESGKIAIADHRRQLLDIVPIDNLTLLHLLEGARSMPAPMEPRSEGRFSVPLPSDFDEDFDLKI